MSRIALLVFAAVGLSSPGRVEVRRGPPLVCYPIEIGAAASLP